MPHINPGTMLVCDHDDCFNLWTHPCDVSPAARIGKWLSGEIVTVVCATYRSIKHVGCHGYVCYVLHPTLGPSWVHLWPSEVNKCQRFE